MCRENFNIPENVWVESGRFSLIPPESELTKVCSCRECLVKIRKLKDFEIMCMTKHKQVERCKGKLGAAVARIIDITFCIEWSGLMLDSLHKNLSAVDNKLGAKVTLGKSTKPGILILKMRKLLLENGIFTEKEEDKKEKGVKEIDDVASSCVAMAHKAKRQANKAKTRNDEILREIDQGLWYFEMANLKSGLIKKMLRHERNERAYKSPQAEKQKLERQIKLLQKLSSSSAGMSREFEVELSKYNFISKYLLPKHDEALYEIRKVCCVIKDFFFQQYPSCPSTRTCKPHNIMEDVLDSLMEKVNSFTKRWKEEFVVFNTPLERCGKKWKCRVERVKICI